MTTETRTAEFLEWDHRLVILVVVVHDNLLVATLANDQTRVTPTEVVHTPEGVDREEQTVHRVPTRNSALVCE